MNNRGSLYASIMTGVMAIAAVTVVWIILDQVYTYNIQPWSIREGVDADNANYMDIAWSMLPIPVLLAVVWGMITAGRDSRSGVRMIE